MCQKSTSHREFATKHGLDALQFFNNGTYEQDQTPMPDLDLETAILRTLNFLGFKAQDLFAARKEIEILRQNAGRKPWPVMKRPKKITPTKTRRR